MHPPDPTIPHSLTPAIASILIVCEAETRRVGGRVGGVAHISGHSISLSLSSPVELETRIMCIQSYPLKVTSDTNKWIIVKPEQVDNLYLLIHQANLTVHI